MRRLLLALLAWAFMGCLGQAWAQGGQISPCPLVTNVKIVPDATYTLSTADYCWWIVFTDPGAITLLLPAPGQFFVPGYWTTFLTLGGGTVTMTGTQDQSGKIHQINLVTTAVLSPGQGANLKVEQDLNWYAFTTGSAGGGGGGCVGFGCLIPLGLGFTTAPGVDNQTPLTIGVNTLYGQTFDSDTAAASYTFVGTDVSHLKTFSSGSLQTATLPTAGTTGFEQGNLVCFLDTGSGGLALQTQSGVLLGVPVTSGIAAFAQYGNGCAESAPPNWKVSASNPAIGAVSSVSITATPCISASPNPIITVGTISTVIPFTVPCGGTGDVTLTAHSVLLGEGTSPVAFATVGTSGFVLTSTGATTDPTFQAIPAQHACDTAVAGLVPATGGGTTNFLRADCTFALPPSATACSSSVQGLVPATGGGTTNFLRADCTFAAPPSSAQSITATTSPCLTVSPNPIVGAGSVILQNPLSVACGGTGDATLTAHSVLLGEGTSPVAFATIGTAGRFLRDNGSGADPSMTAIACADLPAGGCPFDIAMTWNGVPASYTNCTTPTDSCVNVAITRGVSCPASFTGSIALAQVASTGTKVVNINQITSGTPTTRGTATFTASATGVLASGSGMTLAAGDIVQFAFPTTADATLADIAITLKCSRT